MDIKVSILLVLETRQFTGWLHDSQGQILLCNRLNKYKAMLIFHLCYVSSRRHSSPHLDLQEEGNPMRPKTFMQMLVNSTQNKKMLLYLLASGSEIQRLRALEAHSQMHSKRLKTQIVYRCYSLERLIQVVQAVNTDLHALC